MERADRGRLGIKELVQASGVSRRTVRYYVQRGLLPPPEGAGRGHFYRTAHLERLATIKELQNRGMTLEEIHHRFEAGEREEVDASVRLTVPEAELATHIRLSEGVEIIVSHRTEPPRPAQIRALAEAAARILKTGS